MAKQWPATRDEAIDWLRKQFHAESARGLSACFQVDLTGPEAGGLVIRVCDGELEVIEGVTPRPNVRLRLSASDYYAILAGRENADLLYMAGRLEIDGELSLAMKLRSLFRPSA